MDSDRLFADRVFLVVEDEFLIGLDVQRILEDAGAAEVIIASSIPEARATIDSDRPIDVVVLDLNVGGASTAEIMAELDRRKIPFVVASGYTASFIAGIARGTVPVIEKPYTARDLLTAANNALGGPR